MITLLTVGKLKDKSLKILTDEYVKRISAFDTVHIIEVKDEPNRNTDREKEIFLVKQREGERALAKIRPDDFVVLLDLHGKEWDSEGFSENFGKWRDQHRRLTFVIAGSLGPSPALVKRADVRWKLSSLTFTHLMTRVLVLEQIYRAFMILNHRVYHK